MTFPYFISDDHPDRPAKNGAPPASGPSCAENRPVLGVRRSGAAPPHGHLCLDRSLAGLHLVCNRERGTASVACEDRLARYTGKTDTPALHQ